MLIKVFDHEILGCMDVFGDEQGMWFNFSDVVRCLEISKDRAQFKFRYLDSNLKKLQDVNMDGVLEKHRFIHEKAVYEFMLIGKSKYCSMFQKWVGEIAFEMGILNRNIGECEMEQQEITDYQYVSTYINNLDAKTPAEETLKEAFERFDNKFKEITVGYDNQKIIETEKDFDSSIEVTTEEAYRSEFWHPKYNPDLYNDITDHEVYKDTREIIQDLMDGNVEKMTYVRKSDKKILFYRDNLYDAIQRNKETILYNEFEPEENEE